MNPLDPDEIASCVDEVLRSRRSTRAFTPQPVSREQVAGILEVASRAPSNSNTQPWCVHVLAGAAKAELGEALTAAFLRKEMATPFHFPDPLPEAFHARQADFGARYYEALGIDRADMPARARQSQRNFIFFDAPVGLVFTIDSRLKPHSWLDLGLFMQAIMVAARARGLATCPQVMFSPFHAVIARVLDLQEHEVTVCGMSLGHADAEAAVNRFPSPRVPVEQFAQFRGFEPAGRG